MPKFLAGCLYDEEEISQINGNKFGTDQILKKGRILAG
jgi:hypothetical protein